MASRPVRLGIAGCGSAAQIHLKRLLRLGEVQIVGCADPDTTAATQLAAYAQAASPGEPVAVFPDHLQLLRQTRPDALAIFTPHRMHYRPAMDALQAGCHVFIEKPLSTNTQEAVDIVNLARARNQIVAVGHQYRLSPSFMTARRLLSENAIGPVRVAQALLAAPWLATHRGPELSWRFDPRISGGGILADTGDHILDLILWVAHQAPIEVAAFQERLDSGIDVVTGATIRLASGAVATVALSGVSPSIVFELVVLGEGGMLRATDSALTLQRATESSEAIPLGEPTSTIDGDFLQALREEIAPCCPADQALDTVRLQEAIARSAASSQIVRLT